MMEHEDDDNFPSKTCGLNRQKFTGENIENLYVEDDDYEDNYDVGDKEDTDKGEDDDDDDDDDDGGNGVQRIGKDDYEDGDDDNDEDEDYSDSQKHPKKKKLKMLLSSYEFAPRVPPPSSVPKPSYGGRNPLTDWTEHETFVLLNAWGDRFLKQGRKSLRSEEWQEVAEKVSQESSIERTDTQCRNRLDTLKKKYKKEKTRFRESGGSGSKWVYFEKMDTLLSSLPQQSGLSCGVDSGEYKFMNPKVYLNRSNGLDEMRDSPGDSESGDGSEGPPPKKRKNGRVRGGAVSFKLLADSIHKFSEIYEKIEKNKRQQIVELEKMRMDFHRDLELQKKEILERAQAEIVRIRHGGGDEDNDVSGENISG